MTDPVRLAALHSRVNRRSRGGDDPVDHRIPLPQYWPSSEPVIRQDMVEASDSNGEVIESGITQRFLDALSAAYGPSHELQKTIAKSHGIDYRYGRFHNLPLE